MHGQLLQPLVIAGFVSVVATAAHRRLPPRIAANYVAALLAILAIASIPTFVLIAVTFLAHVPLIEPDLSWCSHALSRHGEMPLWLGIGCTVLLAIGLIRATRVVVDHRRLCCHDPRPVAVAQNPSPFAVTLPGAGGNIVMSSGLVDVLGPHETEVVLAHEQAHAELRHDRYLLLGAMSAAIIPPLAWLAERLRFAVERWADETAADRCGDRQLVAATLGKVALVHGPHPSLAGFADRGVASRVRLLLRPPVGEPRAIEWTILVATVVGAGIFAVCQLADIPPLVQTMCAP